MVSVYGVVPFLNGGLFEHTAPDRRSEVEVPDAAVEPLLRDPDGLFHTFNFTVMESTPLDIEVAVDPEMLGKVFEELVTGRHESGAYYTPRPVVAFMCREALKGYLQSRDTTLAAEAVQQFVDRHETSGIRLSSAPAISKALDEVTVIDPACGSGAYLLSMLQELVELQTGLFNVGVDPRSLYEMKLHIIERNLYGVDIDPFAVNIAMLRLWLSLAIEFEGDAPPPLPNLDFKVVCGDSLLGPDPNPALQGDLFTEEINSSDLGSLKAVYMRESDGNVKNAMKADIERIQVQLRKTLGGVTVADDVVDWRIAFAEVFSAGDGFDVVLANPPYVRMERLHNTVEQRYKDAFPEVAASRADLLVYFYARAIHVLKDGGALAFITSNKYMRSGYGKKLRGHLASCLTINQVIDFGDLPVFTATSYPAVLIGQKRTPKIGHELQVADLATPLRQTMADQDLAVTSEALNRAMDGLPTILNRDGHGNYPQAFLRTSGWVLESPVLFRLFERLMNQGTPLGEFVNGCIYMGVKTGLNQAFVVDQAKRDDLIAADPASAEIVKPWLRGRDIKRWTSEWAGLYIIFTNRGVGIDRYPAVRDHLERYRPKLERRATAHVHPWYELQQPQEGIFAEFKRPKIIWPDIARDVCFAYNTDEIYLDMTCFTIPTDLQWLVAILNSRLTEFILCQLTSSLRGGFLRPKRQYMARLPILTPDYNVQRRLVSTAQAAAKGESTATDDLNDMVYNLYGLTRADITLLRDWFERQTTL